MTAAALPPIRLRFRWNAGSGKAQPVEEAARGVSAAIVDNVAIDVARSMAASAAKDWQKGIANDLTEELGRLSATYFSRMIGKQADKSTPGATLSTPGATSFSFKPRWAPYSPKYRTRKQRAGRMTWFRNGGTLQAVVSHPWFWTSTFGRIRVRFTNRVEQSQRRLGQAVYRSSGGRGRPGELRHFTVGQLQVDALREFAALGAVRSSYERDDNFLHKFPKPIAYRLSGNPAYTPYRPLVEVFLEYYLTRSVPAKITTFLGKRLRNFT